MPALASRVPLALKRTVTTVSECPDSSYVDSVPEVAS